MKKRIFIFLIIRNHFFTFLNHLNLEHKIIFINIYFDHYYYSSNFIKIKLINFKIKLINFNIKLSWSYYFNFFNFSNCNYHYYCFKSNCSYFKTTTADFIIDCNSANLINYYYRIFIIAFSLSSVDNIIINFTY